MCHANTLFSHGMSSFTYKQNRNQIILVSPSIHLLPRTLEYTFTTYSLGKESIQGALALYRVLPRALDMMRYRIIHSDVEFLIKCMRRICEILFTFQICLNKPITYCVSLFWKCLFAAVNN